MTLIRRFSWMVCAGALLGGPLWAERASTLDAVLKNPGAFNQMCAPGEPKKWSELPFPGYHRDWSDRPLSTQNVQKLRSDRSAVLKSVSARLDRIAAQVVKNERGDLLDRPLSNEAALSADKTLEICCMALLDLNGSEDLPALLRLESALHRGASYRAPRWAHPEYHGSYTRHVQVLSTIAGLLQNEGSESVKGLKSPSTFSRETRDEIVAAARSLVARGHLRGAAAMPAQPDFR